MSKAVLISIRPKWCELIASGEKTIEVRKTAPKIETPFKCYIYCTNGAPYLNRHNGKLYLEPKDSIGSQGYGLYERLSGKVIREFACDSIFPLSFYASDASFFDMEPPLPAPGTCLTDKEIAEYLGNGKTGYGWHISDLMIYDEPKHLRNFEVFRTKHITEKAFFQEGVCDEIRHVRVLEPLSRPPQSWCYVREFFENMIVEPRQEADDGHD